LLCYNDVEFIARANEWDSSNVYDSLLKGESDEQNRVACISMLCRKVSVISKSDQVVANLALSAERSGPLNGNTGLSGLRC